MQRFQVFRAGEGVELIREAVRVALQEMIELEAAEVIGAARYERTESRRTERNGSRPRTLTTFPKIGPLMGDAKAEVLAFTAFPRAHWPKIWSNNPIERVNKEIKHRARVVGSFPTIPH